MTNQLAPMCKVNDNELHKDISLTRTLIISFVVVRGASRKYRTFCHTKIFIDNRKEKVYAGFITHLHLLLHIVTLDIEALVVP